MARRYSSVIKAVIPAGFCLYLLLGFGLGMNGQMAGAIGKDPTLTDRTEIWAFVLGMHTNPLVGTGYESFWMGRRLQYFWQNAGQGRLNEAHNGYLEVYLNLGIIGVSLAVGLLISGYRTTWKNLDSPGSLGSLPLALWLVFLFYNVTEAGFRGGLLWVVFLIGTLALPKPAKSRILSSAESAVADGKMAPRDASLETAGGW
jgi:O-antigen ligase